MKKILIYNPQTHVENHVLKFLRRRLIEHLRSEKIPFEKSRTECVVIGNTKVFFYEAKTRNDKNFIQRHPVVDVMLTTHNRVYQTAESEESAMETHFRLNQSEMLPANYDLAFCKIIGEIPELND